MSNRPREMQKMLQILQVISNSFVLVINYPLESVIMLFKIMDFMK